jgi:hypothetical protein
MNLSDENVVVALILHYGFDLGGQSARAIVRSWRSKYDPSFLPLAVVESLHLGRYKAVSIEQVLNGWQRRGDPIFHFNPEFAEMVSGPEALALMTIVDDQELASDTEPEKILFSASEIAEVHRSTEVFELSDPALDEGLGLPAVSAAAPVPEPNQPVSLELTPISYPSVSPQIPLDHWQPVEPIKEPPFEPPAQVSQFYYKLRAMAVSAPPKETRAPLPKVPSSQVAER